MFRFGVTRRKPDLSNEPRYPETVKLAEMILFLFICACVLLKIIAVPKPTASFSHFPYPLCATTSRLQSNALTFLPRKKF